MTGKELMAILAKNEALYPYAYKDMNARKKGEIAEAWMSLLKDEDGAAVMYAYEQAAKVCKNPIVPADIFEQLEKMRDTTAADDERLWQEFTKAAWLAASLKRKFGYTVRDENGVTQGESARQRAVKVYAGMSKENKMFCGSVQELIIYGEKPDSDLLSFVKPQYLKKLKHIRQYLKTQSEAPQELLEGLKVEVKRLDY